MTRRQRSTWQHRHLVRRYKQRAAHRKVVVFR
jgi:hypothetical protein